MPRYKREKEWPRGKSTTFTESTNLQACLLCLPLSEDVLFFSKFQAFNFRNCKTHPFCDVWAQGKALLESDQLLFLQDKLTVTSLNLARTLATA